MTDEKAITNEEQFEGDILGSLTEEVLQECEEGKSISPAYDSIEEMMASLHA